MSSLTWAMGVAAPPGPFDDITDMAFEGLWLPSYAGSPWTGTASAGGSGARDLSEATNPPGTGSAVNGYTPADFDGTNDNLNSTATLDDLGNASALSMFCLFNADIASLPAGGGSISEPYAQNGILSTAGGGYWILAYNTDGVTVATNDGVYKAVSVAASATAWHLAQAKLDGANLKLRIDSGSWSSVACGNIGLLTSTITVGQNYNGTALFNGKVMAIGFAASVLSDANFDTIKANLNTVLGLSL